MLLWVPCVVSHSYVNGFMLINEEGNLAMTGIFFVSQRLPREAHPILIILGLFLTSSNVTYNVVII